MYQMSRIPFDKLTASGGGCGICISNLRYSITQSAISPANVTIGGKAATAEQLKDVATTANANSLATIFDEQAVQDQMELASTVGDVGALATNVVSTAMQRSEYVKRDEALKAAEDSLKATDPVAWQTYQAHPSAQALLDIEFNQALQTNPVLKAEYDALPKDKQDTFVQDQINQGKGFGVVSNAEAAWHQTQNQYGPGSDFSRTAQALSGLAAGLASGNNGQALSNLTQPFLASAIGTYFDKLEEDPVTHQIVHQADTTAERLLAHAAAGAVVAYFSGNNAASGATGAVSGEAMAMIVHQQMYDGKPTDQLTTSEKESIRAIATLASGLAGALQGGSFETAATSAAAGYNSLMNNQFHDSNGDGKPDHCLGDKDCDHVPDVIDNSTDGGATQWIAPKTPPPVISALGGQSRSNIPINSTQFNLSSLGISSTTVSPQKQERHVYGTDLWRSRTESGGGGYFNTQNDAQKVLDAIQNGQATFIGFTKANQPIVQVNTVTGYNNNRGAGYINQPTNTFIIKGTTSVSVVPTSPRAGQYNGPR